MELIDNIKQALQVLTNNGKYAIKSLEYNRGCFGNVCVVLVSSFGANIQIVRDKGIMSCSIGNGTEAFDAWEDFNKVYFELYDENIDMPNERLDIIEYIKEIADLIYQNEEMLIKVKDKKLFGEIGKKIFRKCKSEFYNLLESRKRKFDQ